MNEVTIKELINRFVRWHKGVEMKYFFDKDTAIHNFKMFYGDRCIDLQVADLYLNFTICENPLPYHFDKMALALGVTLTSRWQYR